MVIIFSLGLIVGLLLALIVLIAVVYLRPTIERTISQATSMIKKKGEIIEPENEDVENWIDNLKTE